MMGLISEIPNLAFRQDVMSIYRRKIKEQILVLDNCLLDIRTYAMNVAAARAKRAMEEWRKERRA